MKLTFTILSLIITQFVKSQTLHLVAPSDTDPMISGPNNNHFTYSNTGVSKNKLFLFFPGTGGFPFNYTEILKTASGIGYHAIALTYPNAEAINTMCAPFNDLTCHRKARQEIFDGNDLSPLVSVIPANSIKNRTIKLLQYLNVQYPTENWSQYYMGDSILWNKIVVSGHSQGGGHAGYISKIKIVNRVVMFAALDWVNLANQNADWITFPEKTPKSNYFGFVHPLDELVNYSFIQTTWTNYGMHDFGIQTLTDGNIAPFGNSHTLFSNLVPENDPTKYHGSVVSDAYTPMNGTVPVNKPVWEYMIDGPITADLKDEDFLNISIFPNPSSETVTITLKKSIDQISFVDLLGKRILNTTQFKDIDISKLNAGTYIVEIFSENEIKKIKFVKK